MEKGLNHGQMEQNMKECIWMEQKMVKESLHFLMVPRMRANSVIIVFMAMVFIYGLMGRNMREADKIIKCMEWAKLYGLMAGNTVVNTLRIKNKGMVLLNGRMVRNILEIG